MHTKKNFFTYNCIKRLGLSLLTAVFVATAPMNAIAAPTVEERLELQRSMPVDTNQIVNWPTGPVVNAESAILMEAETGAILYAKNIHKQQYPASTTKILTTLIAAERCSLDEWVTFSHDAIYDTPYDSNHIAMDVGEKLTMQDCLNAILIRSANEVSFAVGEHIAGTGEWEDFAPIMNERAKELGAINSNFVNPNGLPDENHYTTAYDLAMIGRGFFENELLCKISTTKQMRIEPTEYQPDAKLENSSNQMLPGRTYAYEYLIGAKTGYTNAARSSLVTCAEKNGLKLICVVLKDESPQQYEDTIALFNYGFSNFEKINVSQQETKYQIDNSLFYTENAIFGTSKPLLSLDVNDHIILPKTIDFEDITSSISYEEQSGDCVATVTYTYQDAYIGQASIHYVKDSTSYAFDAVEPQEEEEPEEKTAPYIYVNWVMVLVGAAVIIAVGLLALVVRSYLGNFHLSLPLFFGASGRRRSNWSEQSKRERSIAARRKADIKRAKQRQRRKKYKRKNLRDYD